MNCDETYKGMYLYLDKELTVWRRWKITRHLDRCPPCSRGFDFELELREVIMTRSRERVPDDLRRRIAEAIGVEFSDEVNEPPQGL